MTGTESALDAGEFGSWLAELQAAMRGELDAEVPCGTCVACCSSSQFVHIGPDETDTLTHIPRALTFPAPRMPKGHLLLGYDEHGRCPMLVDAGCSIYEHRPRTCRTYDCRVFPAAGVLPDDGGKEAIARRATRWKFRHAGPDDSQRHEAVRAAASHLARPGSLPDELAPHTPTQLAVLAIEVHELFLVGPAAPSAEAVRVEVRRRGRG